MLTIQRAYAVLARSYVIPELVNESVKLRRWAKVLRQSPDQHDEVFVHRVGPFEPYDFRRRFCIREVSLAGRQHEYNPVLLRHRPVGLDELATWQVSGLAHLYPTGGCTVFLTFAFVARNTPAIDVPTFVRSLRSIRSHTSPCISWAGADSPRELTVNRFFDTIVRRVRSAITKDDLGDGREFASPDFLAMDLITTVPQIDRERHAGDLMTIFRLADGTRELAEPLRHDFGWQRGDIGVLGRSSFLFSDGGAWQPGFRKRRSTKMRRALLWTWMPAIELVQFQQSMSTFLTTRLRDLNAAMRRAENRSSDFVKNLLKATYYDATLDALAQEVPEMAQDRVFGAVNKIYEVLAEKWDLPTRFEQMSKARDEFLSEVKEWEPGVKRLFGLIPGI